MAFEFREALKSRYELRKMGEAKLFLGVRIIRKRDERKIWLCQDSYIDKIANDTNATGIQELIPNPNRASNCIANPLH